METQQKGENTVHLPSLPIPYLFSHAVYFSPFSYKSQTLQQGLTSSFIANYSELFGPENICFAFWQFQINVRKKVQQRLLGYFQENYLVNVFKEKIHCTQRKGFENLKKNTKQVNETLPLIRLHCSALFKRHLWQYYIQCLIQCIRTKNCSFLQPKDLFIL